MRKGCSRSPNEKSASSASTSRSRMSTDSRCAARFDAETDVGERVRVDTTREHVVGSPAYDPAIVKTRSFDDYYGYYGVAPFWTAGYAYPPYPYPR